MAVDTVEIVFEASIEYDYRRRVEREKLSSEQGREITPAVLNALEEGLPSELQQLYGLNVTIHVNGTRYGSLIVIFSAVIAGLGLLSQYKDLYESIELIAAQARSLITRALGRNEYYEVSVKHVLTKESPSITTVDSQSSNIRGLQVPQLSVLRHSERDGLFYFLLIMFFLQLAVIGFLVYFAIVRSYP